MKMAIFKNFLAVCVLLLLQLISYSQRKDTIPSFIKGKPATGINIADSSSTNGRKASLRFGSDTTVSPYKTDSATRKKHDPSKATLYSAIFPGLGQIYNRKYWKLPLVYAAVGIPAYTYFYNKSWYQKCQVALAVLLDSAFLRDPTALNKVDPKLRYFVTTGQSNSIIVYRNSFRKNQDYSVLFLLLFWGLQIVDATVDAHLRDFDVSTELSMRLQPSGSSGTRSDSGITNPTGVTSPTGVSLVFDIHKTRFKSLSLP